MPFGPAYNTIRSLATYATSSFFSRIEVVGEEHVPDSGPIISVSNHWSGAVDPAMLSSYFPHRHKLHYWAKSTLFKSPVVGAVLRDAGNIPVDRKTKDNQSLFALTFDMLKQGECIAIFPEGTSYTMPGITSFKDGASWAALEYAKNIREKGRVLSTGGDVRTEPKDVTICIAGLSYSDKTKYRSSAVIQFGKSIPVAPYVDEFLEDPKAAVKKLTQVILDGLMDVTVNAADWSTLNAATMARKILWVDEKSLPLRSFRDIGQTLVDIFSDTTPSPQLASLKALLLAYQSTLHSTRLTHYTLSGVPLPSTLDPSVPHPLPTRFRSLRSLFVSTLSSLLRLPFFILPLVVHLPIYVIAKYSLRLSKKEEDISQNKIMLGLILALVIYPGLFAVAWLMLLLTPVGAFFAFGFTWLFVVYHNSIIDDNYNAAKKLIGNYRVLVGVWAPRAKTLLASHSLLPPSLSDILDSPPTSPSSPSAGFEFPGENSIRRVLRLRTEASAGLREYLQMLEEGGGGENGCTRAALLRRLGAKMNSLQEKRKKE